VRNVQGNAPESDSPYALVYSNVIRSETPTKANNGWSPREKLAGRKLPINKRLLKSPLFGLVFAHVYSEERRKHDPRAVPCVWLGYDPVSSNFLVKLTEKNAFERHGVLTVIPRASVPPGKKILKPRPAVKIKVNPLILDVYLFSNSFYVDYI